MAKRIGGTKRKTRFKFSKPLKEKGKLSLTKYFRKFNDGDMVLLKAEPSVQKGMYHGRFHGKVGLVASKKGACYEVRIKDGNKSKSVMIHPIHLRKLN